jgi:hypothetical protein
MGSTEARVAGYRTTLATLGDPLPYILSESRLPGPRANLELVAALGDILGPDLATAYASMRPEDAPGNEPAVVAVVGGIVALGRLLAEGDRSRLDALGRLASDPRWRVREGVAMALQRYGVADIEGLLTALDTWVTDPDPLVQRAVVAGLCEPALLTGHVPTRVLAFLDIITAAFAERADRRSDGAQALRKGLGYGWSVAIAASPAAGIERFERWLRNPDRDIRWIVRENLGKARLRRADPAWHAAALRAVAGLMAT